MTNPGVKKERSVPPTSHCDTSALKCTLEQLVDFDRINACKTDFSVGVVNEHTGFALTFGVLTFGVLEDRGPEDSQGRDGPRKRREGAIL